MVTANFDGVIFGHHAVSGRQVPVHKFLSVEISHSVCDLCCHLHHLPQCGGGAARVILIHTFKTFVFNGSQI